MAAGASLDIGLGSTGPLDVEIRVLAAPMAGQSFAVCVVTPDGTVRERQAVTIPAGAAGVWTVVRAAVDIRSGERLRLEAADAVTVQSVRGFVNAGSLAPGAAPVPGWRITMAKADAVVLEPGG
jgi:hypothetical protein